MPNVMAALPNIGGANVEKKEKADYDRIR